VHTTEKFRSSAGTIKQGDQGTGFYVLEKGAVEVFKDEIMLSVLMFPGTISGAMGNILGKPRSCTVNAHTHNSQEIRQSRHTCHHPRANRDRDPDL
jgi:CRP-like cAMP-binding protein